MASVDNPQNRMYIMNAPVFYPTEAEFLDPIKYIQTIRPAAAKYGICKIIPPQPPSRLQGLKRRGFSKIVENQFSQINPNQFSFQTKLQKIHQLQKREGPSEIFMNDLQIFLSKWGIQMKQIPRIDGKDLDMFKLFRLVISRGGFHNISKRKQWTEIATALKLSSSSVADLQQDYKTYLSAYERSYKRRKHIGEGITPGSDLSQGADGDGVINYLKFNCRRCNKEILNIDEKIKQHLDYHHTRDLEIGSSNPDKSIGSVVPRYVLNKEPKTGKRKRMLPPNFEARKRRRIDMMKMIKIDTKLKEQDIEREKEKENKSKKNKDSEKESIDIENIMCTACGGGEDEDKMLLCDTAGCDNAYHMYCLKKPLSSIPKGDWYCDECVMDLFTPTIESDEDNEDYGFGEGKEFTLAKYKKFANQFSKNWFSNKVKSDKEIPVETVENEFWRIVETAEDYVKVHYGSDLCTSKVESGFPKPMGIPDIDYYWNLHLLARAKGSPLNYLAEDISGVTIPMLYVGMLFSCFCWHTEDNYLYSVNYLHAGAPKTWYGVPGASADKFEDVMRNTLPDLFNENPDLLHHLTTMVSPSVFLDNGVPVYHMVQTPGDLMVTFPQAYHAGFNHGFNAAESVNFATSDWLPFGRKASCRYRKTKRSAVFSHQELICKAVACDPANEDMAMKLKHELRILCDTEIRLRDKICNEGITKCTRMMKKDDEDNKQCAVCSFDCYLSAVSCPCKPNTVVCLRHSRRLCMCGGEKKSLMVSKTLNELGKLRQVFEEKCAVFEKRHVVEEKQNVVEEKQDNLNTLNTDIMIQDQVAK